MYMIWEELSYKGSLNDIRSSKASNLILNGYVKNMFMFCSITYQKLELPCDKICFKIELQLNVALIFQISDGAYNQAFQLAMPLTMPIWDHWP